MKVGDELMSEMGIFSALYLSIKVSRDFLTCGFDLYNQQYGEQGNFYSS